MAGLAGLLALGTHLSVVPAAEAETVDLSRVSAVTVDGRGYGHGRGLSQNGAQGAAGQGLGHRQILDFYYPGAEVYDAGDPAVRVRVSGSSRSDGSGQFTALSGSLLALDDVDRGTSTPLPPGTTGCRVSPDGAGVLASCTGAAPVTLRSGAVRLRGGAGGIGVQVGPSTQRYYRGSVTVRRDGGSTVAVVTSSMQEYLRGVVPLEMPPSWRTEALRAQTVAARTYALRTVADRPAGTWYDLCDTTACQVFQGMRTVSGGSTTVHEQPSTDAAVDATRGVALRHAGRPAFTQFSAANGGWSTGSGTHPYLVARPDPYDGLTGSSSHRWTTSVTVAAVGAAWPSVGQPLSLTVLARDGSGEWGGRATSVRVTGSAGSVTVSGDQVRSALGLRSTWFTFSGSSPREPFGALDEVTRTPAGLVVRGWAADPDSPGPVQVHVYVDVTGVAVVPASGSRPDVGAVRPDAGPSRGFQVTLPVYTGRHTVCAYAVNLGAGSGNTTLGCREVTLSSDPVGALDEVSGGFGALFARGWAWDADAAGPTAVHLWVDGAPAAVTATGQVRTDVAALVPGAGPSRGWGAAVLVAPGRHQVCAYGIDSGGGTNRLLGCRTVDVAASPAGALDSAVATRAGVDVAGWAADPDAPGPVPVHTYVNGRGTATATVGARGDLVPVLGAAAAARAGFSHRVPALGGPQQVCSYGINAGAGDNALLGCRTVRVPSEAFGHLDAAAWSAGTLSVQGWAVDPDVASAVAVHVYADGVPVAVLDASAPRADVAGAHPLHGERHGYGGTVALPARPGTVCAYAVDVRTPDGTTAANPLLGCRTP